MAGVTIFYPSTGEPTHSLSLPFPAHNQAIQVGTNQNIGVAASGFRFVQTHGGTFYRITRVFESLTEVQVKAVFDFLRAVRYAANEVRFHYVDSRSGSGRDVFCKIVFPTRETKLMRNVRDVSIVFEQLVHPDHSTDGVSTTEGSTGGGVVGEGDDPEPHITSALTAVGAIGDFFSYTITATGAATITFGASGLPAWLSRTGAVLSGTPPSGTLFEDEVTITATNDDGVDTKTLTVRIEPEPAEAEDPAVAPTFHSDADLGEIFEDEDFAFTPTVSGSPTIVYSSADLPSFLAIDPDTGEITGTPGLTDAGTYDFTITATNDVDATDQEVTLVVNNLTAPVITNLPTTRFIPAGTTVGEQCVATMPGAWTKGSTPAFITINPTTGKVTFAPGLGDVGNNGFFDVTCTNAVGFDTKILTFNVT